MKVLGLDLETTGLNDESDSITEIGAMLYDLETDTPLEMMNEVISISDPIPERITKLTGITDQMIKAHGKPITDVIAKFNSLAVQAEYLVIHNAPFDLGFLKKLEPIGITGLNLPVIDTLRDIPFDEIDHPSRKLPHLAASHGFLNPFSHRAIFDVMSMLKILSKYEIEEVLEYKRAPTLRVMANVSYDEKDLAKAEGFRWDGPNKEWFKEMKDFEFEAQNYSFNCTTEVI